MSVTVLQLAEVGAYLLGVWGRPFSIVESVAYRHRPGAVTEGPCEVLAAVRVADALAGRACDGERNDPPDARLDLGFLERAGLSTERGRWCALAEDQMCDAKQHGAAS